MVSSQTSESSTIQPARAMQSSRVLSMFDMSGLPVCGSPWAWEPRVAKHQRTSTVIDDLRKEQEAALAALRAEHADRVEQLKAALEA